MTEAELILRKALVGSNLDSRQWNSIQAGLRDRAFFSSQVASMRVLHAAREMVAERAGGNLSASDFRREMRRVLAADGYDAGDRRGTIKDLMTTARLDLIQKTNVEQARGYIHHLEATAPGAFAAFPAQELVRVRQRRQPRDWAQRWKDHGGKFYEGRMIALVDDPIWTAISDFGNPFPPYAFGSGMGVRAVKKSEAVRLGVISADEVKAKVEKLRERRNAPDFNANLQATVPFKNDADWQFMKKHFGDQIQRKGDVVMWREEVFEDAFDKGNFTIKLGVAEPTLLSKLPADFDASGWKNGGFTIDQTWLNNTRDDGSDHRSHFKGYGNDETPLEKRDMPILPALWRNPDRVTLGSDGRNGIPRLVLELDAFDGHTFRAVVDVGTDKPFLKTFFKYKNVPVGSAALVRAARSGIAAPSSQ